MRKISFWGMILIGTVADILLMLPLFPRTRDPGVPIILGAILWFLMFLIVTLIHAIRIGPGRGSGYSGGYNQGGGYNQIADYMATNTYFNNQAMRRNLDQINQTTQNMELQQRFDRLNNGN